MPKPGKIFKATILIIVSVFILIFGLYTFLKLKEESLVILISGGITGGIGLFITVFQFWIKKDSEDTKEDISDLKDDVIILKNNDITFDKKISGLNARYLSLEDQNIVYENALKDIKSGLAEKEEAEYYVYMHVKHKNEITDLCKDIKSETFTTLEDQSELDIQIRKFVIEINTSISNIIIVQYESGFDKFEPKYYKTEILNSIDLSLNNSLFEDNFKIRLHKELKKSTENYIDSVSFILANDNNGIRRENFIDKTLKYTQNLTNKTINTYYKKLVI
jgi:hypothetical protein